MTWGFLGSIVQLVDVSTGFILVVVASGLKQLKSLTLGSRIIYLPEALSKNGCRNRATKETI